ncbi:hypothetical protein ACLBYG_15130 [Methylobacterium sp. D53M]
MNVSDIERQKLIDELSKIEDRSLDILVETPPQRPVIEDRSNKEDYRKILQEFKNSDDTSSKMSARRRSN